jgi:hypothetical protein
MEHPSPYLPPASAPPPMPMPNGGSLIEPSAVRVFGILHLILAGIGILFGIWCFFADQINSVFINSKSPGYEAQLRYSEEVKWVTILTGVFIVTLAGMLIIAGIKLVRSRPDGVAWSNRYAWASIATKLVSLVISVAVLLPATNRMMGGIMPPDSGMPPASAAAFSDFMKIAMSVSAVATPMISCIYPALALFFFSRPQVKEWAARSR